MPIYEYRCKDCGKVSEILVRNNSPVVSCPGCGGNKMEKLFSSSYTIKKGPSSYGTCCGRAERCAKPPCSTGEGCRRR